MPGYAALNLEIWLRLAAMVDKPQMVKGDHSLAARSLQNGSGKQEGAHCRMHSCTLTFAHMETHTGTYKRSFDVWIGLMKPSAKFIAFDGP